MGTPCVGITGDDRDGIVSGFSAAQCEVAHLLFALPEAVPALRSWYQRWAIDLSAGG